MRRLACALAIGSLSVVLVAGCVEENPPNSGCDALGRLEVECDGCSDGDVDDCVDDAVNGCEGAQGVVDGMDCLLDCEPETCDELEACRDDCNLI
jgi:hypothetical protein